MNLKPFWIAFGEISSLSKRNNQDDGTTDAREENNRAPMAAIATAESF